MVLGQTGNIRIDRMLDILSKKVRKCIMFLNIEKIETVQKIKNYLQCLYRWMLNFHILRNAHLYTKYIVIVLLTDTLEKLVCMRYIYRGVRCNFLFAVIYFVQHDQSIVDY